MVKSIQNNIKAKKQNATDVNYDQKLSKHLGNGINCCRSGALNVRTGVATTNKFTSAKKDNRLQIKKANFLVNRVHE